MTPLNATLDTPLPPALQVPSPSRGEGCVPLRLGHATLGISGRPRPGEVRQSWHGRLGESRHGWRQPSPLEREGVAKVDGRGVASVSSADPRDKPEDDGVTGGLTQ